MSMKYDDVDVKFYRLVSEYVNQVNVNCKI